MIKYSISIENDLLTTPYVYNVNLQSINTELSENININFVVINKENTGGIIIENNSGDSLSGDIKDDTTLGDFSNTIKELVNSMFEIESGEVQEILNNYNLELNVENNADLEKNILGTLQGEAEDFVISWDDIEYMNTVLVPKGNVNFSKVARDNEAIGEAKTWLNIICSMALILLLGANYWSTICSFLGIRKDIYETYTEEGDLLIATSEEDLRQGYENPHGYAEILPGANHGVQDRKHYPSNWHG